ncbi:hypothetical protein TRFO_38447 [Tritrichomonas foetus]|uniref:Transmembrane adaptor Erv26 n=1 Tax=Tritrichomonas foetus TaxID=1144522 RepID=A0A1J4J9X1_9EUKA|nr:hypothetical protein TRFO_38447 [Tritrichomonas foetus]|eukprot:OHS95465.1 hypothetical protein TRFO_38447 [Tritrichomonas foetus]
MIKVLILFLEGFVTFTILILVIFAFIYYFASFIEERMKTMTNIIKKLNICILFVSFLFLFSDFSIYVFATVFISNLLWLFILYNGFPFIDTLRPDFLIAILCTLISHFLMMIHFLEDEETSAMTSSSFFLLFVWIIPIMIITSLAANEEDCYGGNSGDDDESEHQGNHSIWKNAISRLIHLAGEFLPQMPDKKD